MRSGTLNVPGIVGLGQACELSQKEMSAEAERLIALRERLTDGILKQLDDVQINGHAVKRLPGNLNMSFAHIEGESLLMGLKEIAVSTGSACTSASLEPSYVLKAIGLADELAYSADSFRLGPFYQRRRDRLHRQTGGRGSVAGCDRYRRCTRLRKAKQQQANAKQERLS